MRRTLAACTFALALTALGCAEGATQVAETGTTSTTEPTTTSAATGENTGEEDEGGTDSSDTTASSTTLPTGNSSSTTEPQDTADTAEDAAGALFGSWQAGDREAVPPFVEAAAADAVFAEDAAAFADAGEPTCEAGTGGEGEEQCTWTGTDRELVMTVAGSDADGWRVVSVTFDPA